MTELLGESACASQWWQVGEARFATREDAENDARTTGERFIAQYQNKPGGPVRRLLPVRGTKWSDVLTRGYSMSLVVSASNWCRFPCRV